MIQKNGAILRGAFFCIRDLQKIADNVFPFVSALTVIVIGIVAILSEYGFSLFYEYFYDRNVVVIYPILVSLAIRLCGAGFVFLGSHGLYKLVRVQSPLISNQIAYRVPVDWCDEDREIMLAVRKEHFLRDDVEWV